MSDAAWVRHWAETHGPRARTAQRRVDFLADRAKRDARLAERYREHLERLFHPKPAWEAMVGPVAWRMKAATGETAGGMGGAP